MERRLIATTPKAASHHQSLVVRTAGYRIASLVGHNILCKYAKYATNAFETRVAIGIASTTDPPARCATNVTMLDRMVRISSGIFSRSNCGRLDGSVNVKRRRGQKSRSSRTKGNVTSIGFAISPSTKKPSTAEYVDNRGGGRSRHTRTASTSQRKCSIHLYARPPMLPTPHAKD